MRVTCHGARFLPSLNIDVDDGESIEVDPVAFVHLVSQGDNWTPDGAESVQFFNEFCGLVWLAQNPGVKVTAVTVETETAQKPETAAERKARERDEAAAAAKDGA